MSAATEEYVFEGHPIRATIALAVRDGQQGQEPAYFSNEAIDMIRTEMRRSVGSHDLMDCVEVVLACALALEEEKSSPKAAKLLIRLCDEPEFLEAMRDLNRDKQARRTESGAHSAERIESPAIELIKNAPKPGAPSPKGSVKVASLDFRKKM
jgi:hypothetical protein